MKRLGIACILSLCVACGGGGGTGNQNVNAALTAQQLVEQCVAVDLQDLTDILNLLQNLLDQTAAGDGANPGGDRAGGDRAQIDPAIVPDVQLDLLQFLVDGTIGWTADLDRNGVVDIRGSVGFKDEQGRPTLPVDLDTIGGGEIPALADILANIQVGTTMDLTFEFEDLILESANPATGNGQLTFEFERDDITTASGSGVLTAGDCSFDFVFDDIGQIDPDRGYPIASLSFDLLYQLTELLQGTIELDGTNVAVVDAQLNNDPAEMILLDLATGLVIDGS